jgi:NADH-quinone oxidoreductase subunit I
MAGTPDKPDRSPRNVKKVTGGTMSFKDRSYLPAVVQGLAVTVRHAVHNLMHPEDIATIQYPEVKRQYPERFRGLHRLLKRVDGTPRCVACYMCSTACPARCIHIEAGERVDDATIEKFPVRFEIDELRCVACGLCVEACPCDAIRMDTGIHPPPVTRREDAILDLRQLLAMPGTMPDGEDPKTAYHDRMRAHLAAGGGSPGGH